MTAQPLVVVKVGGSLLEWPEFPQRLTQWLADRPTGAYVLIAGGGKLCGAVRDADSRFQLGEESAHWMCVDLLSSTAKILSAVLKDVPVLDRLTDLRTMAASTVTPAPMCIFDPRKFLHDEEPRQPGRQLPATWDVTTDSIAARLAECLPAQQLVLVKSCDPPSRSIVACSAAGFVDRFFVQAALPVPRVFCINLLGGRDLLNLCWDDR